MREALAEQLGLAEDELRELLPSGRQTVFSPDFPYGKGDIRFLFFV